MYPGMFLFFMNEPVIGAISFFNLLLIVLLQFLPNVILVVCESFLNIYFVFNITKKKKCIRTRVKNSRCYRVNA